MLAVTSQFRVDKISILYEDTGQTRQNLADGRAENYWRDLHRRNRPRIERVHDVEGLEHPPANQCERTGSHAGASVATATIREIIER